MNKIPNRLISLFADKPFSITTKEKLGTTEIRMAFDNPPADVIYVHRETIQSGIESYLRGLGYQVEDGMIFDKVFTK